MCLISQNLYIYIYIAGVKKFWSDEEKEKAIEIFQNEMKRKKLPSLVMCRKAIMENKIFSDRTPEMLKAFLSNTLKKM